MVDYTQAVQQLVDRVVETVHPLRVILFGSAARDEASARSDIDLLVVMPNGTHRRQTSQTLYRRIRGIGYLLMFSWRHRRFWRSTETMWD